MMDIENNDIVNLQTQAVAENTTAISNDEELTEDDFNVNTFAKSATKLKYKQVTKDDFEIVKHIDKDMEEADIIAKLMSVETTDKPTMVIPLKRLGIPVTLQALTGKQTARIRSRYTRTEDTKKGKVEKLDSNGFNIGLIVGATVKPNWSNPALLKKYTASSGEEVIQRMLLAGEISLLGEAVLDISGFDVTLDD